MARRRRRICRHCKKLYSPDQRNRYHQKFCTEPDCRAVSKVQSQGFWRRTKGKHYFKGVRQVERVQAWRKQNPDYATHSKGDHRPKPLQDLLNSQSVGGKGIKSYLNEKALQDLLIQQSYVLTGFIATLAEEPLQDHIASILRCCKERGQKLHRQGLDFKGLIGDFPHELQTHPVPTTTAADP